MLLNDDIKLCVCQLAIISEIDKEILNIMETARSTLFLADKRPVADLLYKLRDAEANILAILLKFNENQTINDRGEIIDIDEVYRRYYAKPNE